MYSHVLPVLVLVLVWGHNAANRAWRATATLALLHACNFKTAVLQLLYRHFLTVSYAVHFPAPSHPSTPTPTPQVCHQHCRPGGRLHQL
jgi:hypothetical protein